MVYKLNKSFYNTVLCQTFSPCGNYLIIGDIYGSLSIFHISKIIQPDTSLSTEDLTAKSTIIVREDYQVNSLLTTQAHLIVGGVGTIYGYPWRIRTQKNVQPAWSIDIPSNTDGFDKADVNCMLFNPENKQLFAGCGDNNIYVFDVETRKVLKVLSKHRDYIHCLSSFGDETISAGEDGVVNIWDNRTYSVVNKIEPYLDDKVARSDLGKWIGSTSCNEDYILCGGGPRLSLWHYRFLTNSTVFPIDDKGIHVAEIYGDRILAGGKSRLFYHMSFNGDIISEIPTSAVTTYSAVHQEQPFTVLSLAGSSSKIDICSNLMYRDQQLSLC